MNPKAGPSARQATAARMGTPRSPTPHSSADSLGLSTHLAVLFAYYRETILPSPLGAVITGALASRPGRFSQLASTGDLAHVVDER